MTKSSLTATSCERILAAATSLFEAGILNFGTDRTVARWTRAAGAVGKGPQAPPGQPMSGVGLFGTQLANNESLQSF